MASVTQITGLQQVIANIKQAERRVGRGVERGLRLGGLLIMEDSLKEVPRDTSNLAGKWKR